MNPAALQHSYAAFARFERDIASIVANYPDVSRIDPRPLTNLTYSCRIRDAINPFRPNPLTHDN